MEFIRCSKASISVIGKLGSTMDGPNFIDSLWADANAHYPQIESLVKKDPRGTPIGFWGAMSDLSRSFRPWEENYTKGLYLAGGEPRGQTHELRFMRLKERKGTSSPEKLTFFRAGRTQGKKSFGFSPFGGKAPDAGLESRGSGPLINPRQAFVRLPCRNRPPGWTKWTLPAYDYLCAKADNVPETFAAGLQYIKENGLTLAGAAHDFLSPSEGMQRYTYFPITPTPPMFTQLFKSWPPEAEMVTT